MARKRMATFSVMDHLHPASLVPAVLQFDRLAFPYPNPAEPAEWDRWCSKNWDPHLLEYCLIELRDQAEMVYWGRAQRDDLRIRREKLARQTAGGSLFAVPATPAEREAGGKSRTPQKLKEMLEARWKDYWVTPAYSSRAEMQAVEGEVKSADEAARRDKMVLLIGHQLEVPHAKDEKLAFRLAAELARDVEYQKSRRALANWQEGVLARSQTTADDEQELADLISDLNAHIAKSKAERRTAWFFWLLKAPVRAFEGYHGSPSAVNSLIETVEVILKERRHVPKAPLPYSTTHGSA